MEPHGSCRAHHHAAQHRGPRHSSDHALGSTPRPRDRDALDHGRAGGGRRRYELSAEKTAGATVFIPSMQRSVSPLADARATAAVLASCARSSPRSSTRTRQKRAPSSRRGVRLQSLVQDESANGSHLPWSQSRGVLPLPPAPSSGSSGFLRETTDRLIANLPRASKLNSHDRYRSAPAISGPWCRSASTCATRRDRRGRSRRCAPAARASIRRRRSSPSSAGDGHQAARVVPARSRARSIITSRCDLRHRRRRRAARRDGSTHRPTWS